MGVREGLVWSTYHRHSRLSDFPKTPSYILTTLSNPSSTETSIRESQRGQLMILFPYLPFSHLSHMLDGPHLIRFQHYPLSKQDTHPLTPQLTL